MDLKLTRPIVLFDLETTGIDILKDRIIEIGVVKLYPNGDLHKKTVVMNPTIPISKEASDVHGITDEDVKDLPTFKSYAKSIYKFFSGCDIGGFNSERFDIPMLAEEFNRCDISFPAPDTKRIDVYRIYIEHEKRTLEAAYKFYCDKELKNAHSAEADIVATLDCFLEQIKRYKDIGNTVEDIHNFCIDENFVDMAGKFIRDESGIIKFNFGKHKGKPVSSDLKYVEWMKSGDFTNDTKVWCEKILNNKI